MTGAALTKFGLAPSTCVIVALNGPSWVLRRFYGLETTVSRVSLLIATNICPRDCKADAASGHARRIRNAAAFDRRSSPRIDAPLASPARGRNELSLYLARVYSCCTLCVSRGDNSQNPPHGSPPPRPRRPPRCGRG